MTRTNSTNSPFQVDSSLIQTLMTKTSSHFNWNLSWGMLPWLRLIPHFRLILCWVRLSWLRLLPISGGFFVSQTLMTKASSNYRWILCWVRLSWLRPLPISGGFFVEAGAHDGELDSDSLHFELNRGWKVWMYLCLVSETQLERKSEYGDWREYWTPILLPAHPPPHPALDSLHPRTPSPSTFHIIWWIETSTSSPIFEETVRIGSPS